MEIFCAFRLWALIINGVAYAIQDKVFGAFRYFAVAMFVQTTYISYLYDLQMLNY